MKDRARERRGWASHRGFTNCHSEEGRGFVPKNGHAGLFFESDLFPPPPPSRQSRTSCSCYGRKKRKCAVSLGRSLAARQIGRNRTRNGPTRCLLVCTCVHRVVQARLRFVCVGELQQDTTCFPLLFLCRIIFASIFLLLNHRVQENRKILTRSVKNLVDLITAVD